MAEGLIGRLRRKEPGAMDELLREYGPLMRYIVAPILEDPGEREECVADVAMVVWDKIGDYTVEKGAFTTWLTVLTRNAALNRRRGEQRRKNRQEELGEHIPDPRPGPEEEVLRKERAGTIQHAVAQLSQLDRSLFYRKYYYFQSTAQMAAELGLTQRAVEGRLRRIRLRLREALGGEQL